MPCPFLCGAVTQPRSAPALPQATVTAGCLPAPLLCANVGLRAIALGPPLSSTQCASCSCHPFPCAGLSAILMVCLWHPLGKTHLPPCFRAPPAQIQLHPLQAGSKPRWRHGWSILCSKESQLSPPPPAHVPARATPGYSTEVCVTELPRRGVRGCGCVPKLLSFPFLVRSLCRCASFVPQPTSQPAQRSSSRLAHPRRPPPGTPWASSTHTPSFQVFEKQTLYSP